MSRIFSSVNVETMACRLCEVLYYSNKEGYLCGHGKDQVYGPAYDALKALLNKEIGEIATEYAMNSKTWCVSDFAGQIIPAIEEGIEEGKIFERCCLAKKIVDFMRDQVDSFLWTFDYVRGETVIMVYHDDKEYTIIKLDWNDVHAFLDKIK